MKASTTVGRNVRRLRVAAGMPQVALAADAEVEVAHISRLERGLGNPTVAMLERIADVLGVEIVSFFMPATNSKGTQPNLRRGRKRRK